MFRQLLQTGDTFYMNSRFCQLVDYARQSIPDDLKFEREWLPTKHGWMWLEEPFKVPKIHDAPVDVSRMAIKDVQPKISAVAWAMIPEDVIASGKVASAVDGRPIKPGAVEFAVYQDMDLFARDVLAHFGPDCGYHHKTQLSGGFGMWSYFVIQPGEDVITRIRAFEKFATEPGREGSYAFEKTSDMLHEIRWIYTAMHLMSEKLAMTVEHRAERQTRRRMEKEHTPIQPLVRLVTLRRMEEARAEGKHSEIDWQWQWHVQGHWRKQWYPKEQVHKMKWIEEYIKGPQDKPLKPAAITVYKVER